MVYQKKIQKWALSVGLPEDFWIHGDSAPLKEFLSKLLSSEILRTAPDIVVAETIPFEKLLSIAQFKLGIHACLVGADLFSNDANLKIGLFATVISLKSALSDFKPEILLQIQSPDFGVAGGSYSNKAICQKCTKPILFIERIIVAERAFHRSCMHCLLCGKRLFLGMFRIVDDHLECFEHLLNKAITGNELLSFETAKSIKSPPPRPPPPRKSAPANNEESEASPVPAIEGKKIEKQKEEIQPSPVPPPTSKSNGNGGSDQSEGGNFEMIDYPEQLNPFSDDEIDKLSDNISSLNPFGSSSDESEESDIEQIEKMIPPVPAPRKALTETLAEAPSDKEIKVVEEIVNQEEAIKKEEGEAGEKAGEKTDEKTTERAPIYPNLKKLFVDTESEALFNFYLPSSLVLCKKRLIDMSEFDRPKLMHELDKVIKTLDYIEKTTKDCERTLFKEISKGDFKWSSSPLVDEFGKSMKLKHENLLKGSMIVHEYLKNLLEKAIIKIDQNEGNQELRSQLVHLQAKLKFEHSAIPSVMEEEVPAKPKREKGKKALVKRIKKVF